MQEKLLELIERYLTLKQNISILTLNFAGIILTLKIEYFKLRYKTKKSNVILADSHILLVTFSDTP